MAATELTTDGVIPSGRRKTAVDSGPDLVRDHLRSSVVEHHGAADGELIVDETGLLKKGTRSAGVTRHYSGTTGRIKNSQIGVFPTYAAPEGRTFLDRELYLPKAWTNDRERCDFAEISADLLKRAWSKHPSSEDHDFLRAESLGASPAVFSTGPMLVSSI